MDKGKVKDGGMLERSGTIGLGVLMRRRNLKKEKGGYSGCQ